MLFGLGKMAAAMMVAMNLAALRSTSLLRASPAHPYRSRSPGDLAHKRWKRARASGRS